VLRPVLQILENGVADLLRQWQTCLPAGLARDHDSGVSPVEVKKTKSRHIAGAKSQPYQQ
jgi:hypothetical protein